MGSRLGYSTGWHGDELWHEDFSWEADGKWIEQGNHTFEDCSVGCAIPTKIFGSGVIFHGIGARCCSVATTLQVTGVHLMSG